MSSLLFAASVAAQNLVPNPSFEELEDPALCPCLGSEINFSTFWSEATRGTSDLHNACYRCPGGQVSVPNNGLGAQSPVHGDSYGGFFAFIDEEADDPGRDYREYLQTPLVGPLEPGATYEIRFSVSLADGSQFAVADVGAYLTSGPITTNLITPGTNGYGPIQVTPQIENTGGILGNAGGWTLISGLFTATGGEDFLVIGNFKPRSLTSYLPRTPSPGYGNFPTAYYYVDDVRVRRYVNGDTCDAQVVNLDFEPLQHDDVLESLIPDPHSSYSEDGFTFRAAPGAEFFTYGLQHPFFTVEGSTAIHTQAWANVARNGYPSVQQPFNLLTIELSELDDLVAPGQVVTLTGTKSGGGTVEQTVLLDGDGLFGVQRFDFTTLNDVVDIEISIDQGEPLCQVDNVCIGPVGCSCNPFLQASEGHFCVVGDSDGVGWSWAIGALASETVAPVAGDATDLSAAFATSVNASTVYPTASAVVDLLRPECFELFVPGTTSFSLAVGPVGGTNCIVSGNPSGCTFNPTIIDAAFLPPPSGTHHFFPLAMLPALTRSSVWILLGSLAALGTLLLRLRRG